MAAMVTGKSWMEAVFSTTKRIMPLVGASPGFFSAMALMAANPRGVAAFPSPRKFAEIFMHIFPFISISFRYSGNSLSMTGEKALAKRFVRPLFSAIFKKPIQAHMLPSRNRESSTASFAPSITAAESPPKRPVHRAHTILARIIPAQIKFNISLTPLLLTLPPKKFMVAIEKTSFWKGTFLCCLEKKFWIIGTIS